MGQWLFRKPEPKDVQGTCVKCKTRKQTSRGGGLYRPLCARCHKERTYTEEGYKERKRLEKNPYAKHRGGSCDLCGFEPVHPCQLDVDHIDGDHSNNSEQNLQTLCANCHRLKTYLCRDWE